MNYIAITREGDSDKISVNGLQNPIYLGDKNPNFVKWSKNRCTIVFVGMFTIHRDNNDRIIVYSLPKYFPKEKCNIDHLDEIKDCLKKICQVVEDLRAKGKEFDDEEYLFDPYEEGIRSKPVNRVELAEFILEDYMQYGLYVKDLTETIRGGGGRTNWAKTVTHITPLFQKNTPMYLELMNKRHIIDENDVISIIHANVVNQCLEFMNALLFDGIDYIDTEELGGDLSMYSSVINSQITYVFKERDINLFKALEAWCANTRYYRNYAGVTCFDRVWEWVNDSVWGNTEHPESKNPIYHIGNTDYEGKGEAIPDTIRIVKNAENKCCTYIFDSKYYTVSRIQKKEIIGYPNNSDIVKQVAYLKLIKSQYGEGEYYNSFLMPESSENCGDVEGEYFKIPERDWFRRIGFVKPGSFSLDISNLSDEIREDEKEKMVGIVLVNPDKLYNRYLEKYKAEEVELRRTTQVIEESIIS